jgi:hypothetical protein
MTDDAPATKTDIARLEAIISSQSLEINLPALAKVSAHVEHVEATQERHVQQNEEQHAEISAQVSRVHHTMFGDNGGVGLTERVRILERLAQDVSGWGRWVKFGVAGMLLKAVWDLIQFQVSNG